MTATAEFSKAFTYRDHLISQSARLLSRLIGVRNITRPFWNRWRASLLGDEAIFEFLRSISSLDHWKRDAARYAERLEAEFQARRGTLAPEDEIAGLRRLSYLYHLAQWGCLDTSAEKREFYRKCRDYYVEAAGLASPGRYHRMAIPWEGKTLWGNLHLPAGGKPPYPLIVIVHGMDDAKEEHFATELSAAEHGFAVLSFDGPGQAESLFLDDILWPANFHESASQAITAATRQFPCSPERVGLVGISWGGLWALKCAATDSRVRAVYDLGGPIDTSGFQELPYFLKAKLVQITGVTRPEDLPDAEKWFSLARDELDRIRAAVRICHGGKDPLVPMRDKRWLRDELERIEPGREVSLLAFADGDHCCTGQAAEVRDDSMRFFARHLM